MTLDDTIEPESKFVSQNNFKDRMFLKSAAKVQCVNEFYVRCIILFLNYRIFFALFSPFQQ